MLSQEHFLLELVSCGRGRARLKWAREFGIYQWGHFPWGHLRTIIVCFECSGLCLSSSKDLVKLSVILARFMLVEWYNVCIVIFVYICDDDCTSFISVNLTQPHDSWDRDQYDLLSPSQTNPLLYSPTLWFKLWKWKSLSHVLLFATPWT